MDENFFDKNPEKTTGFYIAIVALLLLFFLSLGIDVTEFLKQQEINIPSWFFYIIFSVDILIALSILSIYFYRKVGVYLYPILVVTHLFLHEFYLSTLLYADLFNLFAFVGLGLLMIIPKWRFFK